MAKYTYGERVVKKLRKVLCYDQRISQLIAGNPHISLDENFDLASVRWDYCGLVVIATAECVTLHERGGSTTTIMYYQGFDALLSMR